MERHKCKLCSRTFVNGRALGGHMKAHIATLPLPLPPKPEPAYVDSASLSFSSSKDQEQEEALSHRESDEKPLIYGLRENPKKSFWLADPEFSFANDTGSFVVVQDRESEIESSKNPTRKRSKRTRKTNLGQNSEPKKPKLSFMESPPPPPPPPMEPEPLSCVSDTSPDEDVAMCLMMLSRDQWKRKRNIMEEEKEEEEVQRSVVKLRRVEEGKQQCQKCGKMFRSSRAFGSHKSICLRDRDEAEAASAGNDKIFECPFCSRLFGSGQALGGHKRSHIVASSSSSTANGSTRLKKSFIDLNLPTPPEHDDDDHLSAAVSDA